MSASFASAMLVSVPKCWNGVAGAGLRSRCVRSLAVSTIKSEVDVAGILTWYGKNSTVSLCRVPLVLGIYSV